MEGIFSRVCTRVCCLCVRIPVYACTYINMDVNRIIIIRIIILYSTPDLITGQTIDTKIPLCCKNQCA
jgi:hypothetical protein